MQQVLSAQLGHSSATVTRDVYRHVYDTEREGLTFDPVPSTPATQVAWHQVRGIKHTNRQTSS